MINIRRPATNNQSMIPLPSYKDKKTAVFGLGKAGKAAVASLLAGGAEVYAWDDKAMSGEWPVASGEKMPLNSSLATRHSPHLIPDTEWPWEEMAILVLSPGVPLTHPEPHRVVRAAQQAGVPIKGEVELLWEACPDATYVGITGTNGKSTTTALIGHILLENGINAQIGGNLGTPALALDRGEGRGARGEEESANHSPLTTHHSLIFVLEMSSYQLDLLHQARFNVACLLNITPDHLDRHGDMQGYIAAKRRIFMNQSAGDTAIIGIDDEDSAALAHALAAERKNVQTISLKGSGLQVTGSGKLEFLDPDSWNLPVTPALRGAHNRQNAAMAYAACTALGVAPERIIEAMQAFPGLAHRMQQVATLGQILYINDSKATNADAAAKALGSFERIFWIAGGRPKAGGITTLGPYFPRILHSFLIGEAEDEFAATLEGKVHYTRCGTLERAVTAATQEALVDGQPCAILLSPACASFDQWANFEMRGDAFRDYAETLVREWKHRLPAEAFSA